jgi:hypothetical protein
MQTKAITKWITDTDQSMEVVESPSFKAMVAVLQKYAKFPLKTTASDVSTTILDTTTKVAKEYKGLLARQIVWTTQGWTTAEDEGSSSFLTAHFITSSFDIEQVALQVIQKPDDESTLVTSYLQDTANWGMTPGLDYDPNTSTFNAGFVSVESSGSSTLGTKLEKDHGLVHVDFVDQRLAATVQVALDDESISNALSKARTLLTELQDGHGVAALKKIQMEMPDAFPDGPLELPSATLATSSDCWWTMGPMVDRLLKLKPAMEKYESSSTATTLESTEWDALSQLGMVLTILVTGVEVLQNKTSVTASMALVVLNMIRNELVSLKDSTPDIENLVTAVLSEFDKTFGSLDEPFQGSKTSRFTKKGPKGLHWSVLLAYALDPRYKNLPHIGNSKNAGELHEALLLEMEQANVAKTELGDTPRGSAMMNGGRKAAKSDVCVAEFNTYLNEPALEDSEGSFASANPLDWWKANQTRLPILASLARVYLAMPISAAALVAKFGTSSTSGTGMPSERLLYRANTKLIEVPAPTVKTESPTTPAHVSEETVMAVV